jgi:hypothetical protein
VELWPTLAEDCRKLLVTTAETLAQRAKVAAAAAIKKFVRRAAKPKAKTR